MRGLGLLTMTAVVGLVLTVPAQEAAALDIDNILIFYGCGRSNGALGNYFFEVKIEGTGLTDGVFTDTTTPADDWWSFGPEDGGFGYFEGGYASLAALLAAHPNPTGLHLYFNQTSPGPPPTFEDQVLLGFGTTWPTDYGHITFPPHNGVGVPLNPTYTWDNVEGAGMALALWGHDDTYQDFWWHGPDFDMTMMSWTPGPLSPVTGYQFGLCIFNVTGGQPLELETLNGDEFTYYGLTEEGNQVDFTTTEIPEPASMMLVGTAALVLLGLRRRRRMG